MQKIFTFSHRWFGIIAGLHFLLMGLSGSYLTFEDTFESWIYPERHVAAAASETFDLAQIVRVAQDGASIDRQPNRLIIPEANTRTARLLFTKGEGKGKPWFAYVDPSQYEFRGSFPRDESVGRFLFAFHHELFLDGSIGRPLVGISGILLLLLLFSGLWLWWPKAGQFKKSLRLSKWRGWYKGSLDLHKLTGFYSVLLMIAIVFSGVYLAVPGWFNFSKKPEPAGEKKPMGEMPAVDYTQLQQQIQAEGLALRPLIVLINNRDRKVIVRQNEREFQFDPGTSTLKPVSKDQESFDMKRLQHDIHTGDYASYLGKTLSFIGGFLPLFFYISGFYVWNTRRRLRSN